MMTPMERVLTALALREPDRVPLFLMLTMHGAAQLGLTIRDYFSSAKNVIEGQLRMRERWGHDCLFPFFYAAIEVEAWGTEVVFADDGPPNSGAPLIRKPSQIEALTPPDIETATCLHKVLETITVLRDRSHGEVPIIGVVMSPFSLPVMQLGFEAYIELMHERPDLVDTLVRTNEEFCVAWANAQLAAGATAVLYFDPVSSPTIVPAELLRESGFTIAARTIARINGRTVFQLASSRSLPVIDDLVGTGSVAVSVSNLEDMAEVKAACAGRLAVIGNLNGIEMRRWTPEEAAERTRTALDAGAPGGGFILSDGHGEIPWQVSAETLTTIADTVRREGCYPLHKGV